MEQQGEQHKTSKIHCNKDNGEWKTGIWAQTSEVQVALIRRQESDHFEALRDIAQCISDGFNALGYTSEVVENQLSDNKLNFIIGWHLLGERIKSIPTNSIVYNLEQLNISTNDILADLLIYLSNHLEIWDYNNKNIDFLLKKGIKRIPKLLRVGTTESMQRIAKSGKQDIDVLFYGSLNGRRARIIDQLKKMGLNVVHLWDVYGEDRDSYIARSKVVLNMHFYETNIFEIVRVSYLMANSKAVVTECSDSTEIDPALLGGLKAVKYDDLAQACYELVFDENARAKLEENARKTINTFRQEDAIFYAMQPSGPNPLTVTPMSNALMPKTSLSNSLMPNASMPNAPAENSIALVIPVYLPSIDGLDLFSLQYSINVLKPGRKVIFVCPETFDNTFYSNLFPNAEFIAFEDCYFKSIKTYCELLLSEKFYRAFVQYEFMLISQTDAILLRDDLDYWCSQEYDYIGAPWPFHDEPPTIINTDRYKGQNKSVRCLVGNGGLSLRRVAKCIELIKEFPEAISIYINDNINEDMFFSRYGLASDSFKMPDELTASKFSMEMSPHQYQQLNGGCMPMGGHGWWKYYPEFWLDALGPSAEPIREAAFKANAAINAQVEKIIKMRELHEQQQSSIKEMEKENMLNAAPMPPDATLATNNCQKNIIALVIPIYLPTIDGLDLFSLQYSLKNINPNRKIIFVCPKSLNRDFYSQMAPSAEYVLFDDNFFQSINSYSELLLNEKFYKIFENYEFILLSQTDAILYRDELDHWCEQGFDYIGAPWPYPNSFVVNTDRFKGQDKRVACSVGNGGLSLRRVKKCIDLLREFPEASANLAKYGINEDLFFSMYGLLSDNFTIPDKIVASKFSMEIYPEYFYHLNSGHAPMGSHAWWKYNPEFFLNLLGDAGNPVRGAAIAAFDAFKKANNIP